MSRNPGDDPVEVGQATAVRASAKALQVRFENNREIWIPKVGIHDDSEVWKNRQSGLLVLKSWCAEIKGLA